MTELAAVQDHQTFEVSMLSAHELFVLEGLETEIAMGWCELLLGSLGCMDRIRASGSDAAKKWLASIETRSQQMVAIELEHGNGCLLDLSHPVIQDFYGRRIIDGSPFISEAQIKAARQFQAKAEIAFLPQ